MAQNNLTNDIRIGKLFGFIGRKRKIVIMTHNYPDPDAIASAFAFQFILREKLKKKSIISFAGEIGRFENRELVRRLKIQTIPVKDLDLANFSVIILIDTQPKTGNNALPMSIHPHIVIDHHPLRKESTRCPYFDIRPEYGSTATILTEYFRSLAIVPSKRVATALYYGLKTDTNNLLRSRNKADLDAFNWLFPMVSLKTLAGIEYPSLTRAYLMKLAMSIENAYQIKDAVIACLGELNNPENVAELAELLLRVESIRWSLCLGEYEDYLFISVRTSRRGWYAGKIALKLLENIGFGGGHEKTAGGNVSLASCPDRAAKDKLYRLIVKRFIDVLGLTQFKGRKVFQRKPDDCPPDLFPDEE